MTSKVVTVALAWFAAVCLWHAVIAAAQPRTIWSGVYTEAQAKRAEPLYMDKCSKCHAPEMTGKDGPPITGAEFAGNWNGLSVNDLFEKIRIGMPDDAKNTLTRPEVADLIALMLQKAGLPAGATELPTDAAALKDIAYVAVKP